MSFITKNFKVEVVLSGTVFTDISDFVVSLDDFVLQSTGKLNTCKLTLNSEFGNFITNDGGGATPLLNQFQLMRVRVIGDDGITEDVKVFEITTDLSQLAGRSSYFLPIEMEGRERNLSGVPFGGFFRSATHKEIVDQIRKAYNEQIKTAQPSLLISAGVDIPDFNPNIWDFTQVDNCYDALLVVLDSLNLPVSAGGGGNRYGMFFEDNYNTFDTDLNIGFLDITIIIQGQSNAPGPFPVLEQNDDHPITKIDRIKNPSTGTVSIARGRPKSALSPQNYSDFISSLEFYRSIRLWNSTIAYPTGSHVSFDKNVGGWAQRWQANADTTPGDTPGISGNWTAINVGDFIGDIQYSPFTIDKRGPILNGFANPTGLFDTTSIDAVAVPDHNLVINDVRGVFPNRIGTFRDMVIFRTNSPELVDIQALGYEEYLKEITPGSFGFINGTRVLVDPNQGALVAPFDGNDENGIPFSGNMAEYVTPPGAIVLPFGSPSDQGVWRVIREALDFDQCAVYAEAKVYEWNVLFPKAQATYVYPGQDRRRGGAPAANEWRDISDVFMGNDCFHNPISVENVTGLVGSTLPDGEPLDFSGTAYNDNSGIEVTFGYNGVNETQDNRDVWFKLIKQVIAVPAGVTAFLVNLGVTVFGTYITPQYTNMGWWFAWPSPYPFSTYNGISEELGDLYGGSFATINDHRFYDLFNISKTPTGLSGWTQTDSQDLSEITGVEFLFNFDITVASNRIPLTGDVPFAYWCLDRFGTLWKSPKQMYRHLGETQQIQIEFGDLSPVFRGRTPLGIDNILENIIVGEIEVNEVFFKDNIIMQGFQCETPYDEFGRYSPNLWEQVIPQTIFDAFLGGNNDVRFTGIIDAYGFTKTPVAISAPNALSLERTIIPEFEDYQNITNTKQLQRFADSNRDIEQFQYQQYTVEQGGIVGLGLEDSVALTDPFMINDADQGPNSIVVTTREKHYSVPADGGLIRKLVLVKVIDT